MANQISTSLPHCGKRVLRRLFFALIGLGMGVTPLCAAPFPMSLAANHTAQSVYESNGTQVPSSTPTSTPTLMATASSSPNRDGPHLQLGKVGAIPGGSVTVPISYTSNGHSIASMVFAVKVEYTCLQFDQTDGDNDGRLDAIAFQLPTGYNGTVSLNSSGNSDQLNFVIFDPTLPFQALPDSTLATITFQVRDTATCRPQVDSPVETAVTFAESPPASFGSNTGTSVPGGSDNGMVTIYTLQAGDGNGDGAVDAADLTACAREIFDGDGSDPAEAGNGSFWSTPGCDANRDITIDAGDLSCVVLLIFAGSDSCESNPIIGTESAQLTLSRLRQAPDGSHTISIHLAGRGYAIVAASFALQFDPSIDPTDDDSDGLPDVIRISGTAEGQAMLASWQDQQLHIAMTEERTPFTGFADGTLLTVTVTTTEPVGAAVTFVPAVPPSLGSADGRSVPVDTLLESVRVFLPILMR